ncbi:hypothetical protein HYX03_03845 [Candidatus Woesearchaeota archaeon]|nr:hypothetical protein [Candidatus Woesearchaeota archaeon]
MSMSLRERVIMSAAAIGFLGGFGTSGVYLIREHNIPALVEVRKIEQGIGSARNNILNYIDMPYSQENIGKLKSEVERYGRLVSAHETMNSQPEIREAHNEEERFKTVANWGGLIGMLSLFTGFAYSRNLENFYYRSPEAKEKGI